MPMPRSIEVLENDPNLQCVAVRSPKKIDASRFSGTEQYFAGAPFISLLKSNVTFSTSIDRRRCLDRSRCSKTIQIYSALQYVRQLKSTHRGFKRMLRWHRARPCKLWWHRVRPCKLRSSSSMESCPPLQASVASCPVASCPPLQASVASCPTLQSSISHCTWSRSGHKSTPRNSTMVHFRYALLHFQGSLQDNMQYRNSACMESIVIF